MWVLPEQVNNWAVLLPYPNCVQTGTTHWMNRDKWRRLARTIASLSRNWQLLDSLALTTPALRALDDRRQPKVRLAVD